jgi:hypothetical protein
MAAGALAPIGPGLMAAIQQAVAAGQSQTSVPPAQSEQPAAEPEPTNGNGRARAE